MRAPLVYRSSRRPPWLRGERFAPVSASALFPDAAAHDAMAGTHVHAIRGYTGGHSRASCLRTATAARWIFFAGAMQYTVPIYRYVSYLTRCASGSSEIDYVRPDCH